MPPTNILLCTDLSEFCDPAGLEAVKYARAFNAKLTILYVVETTLLGHPGFGDALGVNMVDMRRALERVVAKDLERLADEYRHEVDQVEPYIRVGMAAPTIVSFADEQGVDLIVMGTQGRTGIKRLIMGSTAQAVVCAANCPVMTVRCDSEACKEAWLRRAHPENDQPVAL